MEYPQYVLSRVEDAIEKAKGNMPEAQRIIIHWLEEDKTLLAGLVAPHMAGIVTHAVSHIDHKNHKKTEEPSKNTEPKEEGELEDFLMSTLAGAGSTQYFGQLQDHVERPGKASQSHIDAIYQLAKKDKD